MMKLDEVSLCIPQARVRSLRQALTGAFKPLKADETVCILDGVTLDLPDGTRLGLLGRNGAGKSTLLRVMGGVFEPTSGSVECSGRAVSLFDLHFGMDEEASGHANLQIAGALLGISSDQIENLRTEIVEFSELGDALSRPLKTYSSGMRVRLAFALITSIEADNLLVDEIIGVGDSAFLDKARRRIQKQIETSSVFVLASHSDAMLRDFCTTGLVMETGKAVFHGPIEEAIAYYNGMHAGGGS